MRCAVILLREAGVVVVHGSAYGRAGEGTLRVSFAAGGETLERGLERLRDGLQRLAARRTAKGSDEPRFLTGHFRTGHTSQECR